MDKDWLAQRFDENRSHLYAVAYRMLGSRAEADDAVQEAWLKLDRAETGGIQNLRAWLTTVVARVCLDMLRSRQSRGEEPHEHDRPELAARLQDRADPEREALLAESVSLALMVVLERLDPAERIAFVLHDTFGLNFDEIASIVGRSEVATRQLASRARRRVRGAELGSRGEIEAQKPVVAAFLSALRNADFEGLLAVLDPDVEVRVEGPEGVREIHGAAAWAKGAVKFAAQAASAEPALVDGSVGLILAPGGKLVAAIRFTVANGRIVRAEVVGEPEHLRELELAVLE
jgi:RNA polymerase sigma-70 factor (ECF subfamily)